MCNCSLGGGNCLCLACCVVLAYFLPWKPFFSRPNTAINQTKYPSPAQIYLTKDKLGWLSFGLTFGRRNRLRTFLCTIFGCFGQRTLEPEFRGIKRYNQLYKHINIRLKIHVKCLYRLIVDWIDFSKSKQRLHAGRCPPFDSFFEYEDKHSDSEVTNTATNLKIASAGAEWSDTNEWYGWLMCNSIFQSQNRVLVMAMVCCEVACLLFYFEHSCLKSQWKASTANIFNLKNCMYWLIPFGTGFLIYKNILWKIVCIDFAAWGLPPACRS